MPKLRSRQYLGAATGSAWGAAAAFLAPLALVFLVAATLPASTPPQASPPPPRAMTGGGGGSPSRSRALFERRIRPLLAAKNPSSCSECHLSGVDLKDYIRPSENETFTALRQQGLVDLKRPAASRILRLIQMSRPSTPLLTQQARNAEYGAFRDWIVAAASNPKLVALAGSSSKPSKKAGPSVPNAVIRHTRIDSVVASFERNVWSQEGRCMSCHRPDNKKNIEKFGQRVAWFVPDDPEATMKRLIAQGAVNVEKPEESLLLLKPLNKVPHGGGVKMLYGDAGYKMFRAWLEDYAKSVKGRYRTAKELPARPAEALVHMDTILNVTGGPASWADKLLRVDVYPWDESRRAWAQKPIATGERGMFGGKDSVTTSSNLIMFLIAPAAAAADDRKGQQAQQTQQTQQIRSRLTSGGRRYLLKYYCDTAGRLNQDYTIPTDSPEFYQGQQEVTVASWSGGWGKPVRVKVALSTTPPSDAPGGGSEAGAAKVNQ